MSDGGLLQSDQLTRTHLLEALFKLTLRFEPDVRVRHCLLVNSVLYFESELLQDIYFFLNYPHSVAVLCAIIRVNTFEVVNLDTDRLDLMLHFESLHSEVVFAFFDFLQE